jgi:hypothetical protein
MMKMKATDKVEASMAARAGNQETVEVMVNRGTSMDSLVDKEINMANQETMANQEINTANPGSQETMASQEINMEMKVAVPHAVAEEALAAGMVNNLHSVIMVPAVMAVTEVTAALIKMVGDHLAATTIQEEVIAEGIGIPVQMKEAVILKAEARELKEDMDLQAMILLITADQIPAVEIL